MGRYPIAAGLALGAAMSAAALTAASTWGIPAPPAEAWTPLPFSSVPRLRLRLTGDATTILYIAQLLVGAAAGTTPAAVGAASATRATLVVAAAVTHVGHLGAIVAAKLLSKRVLVDVLVDSGDHPLGKATGSPWWAPMFDGPLGYGALAFLVIAATGSGRSDRSGSAVETKPGWSAVVTPGGWVMRRGCRRANGVIVFLLVLFLSDRFARGVVREDWMSMAVGGGLGIGVVAAAVAESRAVGRLRGTAKLTTHLSSD
ncbi:hypothetical protein MMPV_002251 [Pyropia vietnamensis]